MRKKVLIALRMAGVAGQMKLAGAFRYLRDVYGDRQPWDITLVRTKSEFDEDVLRAALASGTDGFIVSIPDTEDSMRPLAEVDVPTIVMDIHSAPLDGRTRNITQIRNSGGEIGAAAADYFLSQGIARSYAFLHSEAVKVWSSERFAAFRRKLNDRGLWCEELFEPSEVVRLRRPAAVLAANDDRAFELVVLLRSRRLRVPQDIAVLGINNDTLICENCRPRLSSLQPDFESEGFLAAKTLDAMMRGRTDAPRTLFVGVKSIVRRESTAEPTHAGKMVQKAVAFIDRHALEGIKVKDVVAHLRCSRRLADLRFRQLQGRSILEAITDRRLDEVKRLLLETRDPMDSIALQCGYPNPNYLKNLFKKRFSMTMRDFRGSSSSARSRA